MMTYEQILIKLTAICARGEHCLYEMEQKMERWQIDSDTQQRVLDYLIAEKYIDEKRYARFFVNDKMKYNKWGRKKIEQALWMKHVSPDDYKEYLDTIEDENYEETLLPLLAAKRRSVKGKDDYEIKMKLIRYAMQRGFSYDQARKCAEEIYR